MSIFDLEAISFGVAPVYPAFGLFAMAFCLTYISTPLKLTLPRPLLYLVLFGMFNVASILGSAWVPPDYLHLSVKQPWVFGTTQAAYVLAMVLAAVLVYEAFVSFPRLVHSALRAHIIAAVFVSIWGFYQFVAYYNGWPYSLIFNNNEYYAQAYMQSLGPLKRVNSTALEPSTLAMYLLTAMPISLYSVAYKVKIIARGFDFAALCVISMALLMTTALTAFLGIAILAIIAGLIGRLSGPRAILLFIAIAVTCVLFLTTWSREIERFSAVSPIVERFSRIEMNEDLSTNTRWNSLVTTLAMFLDHPIAGVGIGNTAFYYYLYSDQAVEGFYPRIYSYGARILAELGLVGVLLISIFLFLCVRSRPSETLDKNGGLLWESLWLTFLTSFATLIISQADIVHFEVWFLCGSFLALSHWRDQQVVRVPGAPKRFTTVARSR